MSDPRRPELPVGYEGLIRTCGQPPEDMEHRRNWEAHNLVRVPLLAPIPLAWDPKTKATQVWVHKYIQDVVTDTFMVLYTNGLWNLLEDFGGAYMYRTKRGYADKLSVHSFGMALDFCCKSNPLGKKPKMPDTLVKAFTDMGWVWGGTWKRPDGQHLQYARQV